MKKLNNFGIFSLKKAIRKSGGFFYCQRIACGFGIRKQHPQSVNALPKNIKAGFSNSNADAVGISGLNQF
jgi:hypothetical protein